MNGLDKSLIHAAQSGDLAAVQAARAAGANGQADENYALQVAANRGHTNVVQLLIAAGADVQAAGGLALSWAAENGRLAVAQCLLAAGADVRAHAKDSPLMLATLAGHPDLIRLLVTHGAAIQPVLPVLEEVTPAMQVALIEACDIQGLSPSVLARRGVCPEALCTLLARQGWAELAATLKATQMLDPLEPKARAVLLRQLLAKPSQRELAYVGP